MILSIIRHGLTQANERRLYCGHTDVPLSEQGKQDLMVIKDTVAYPVADVFITSGLIRTSETLRILYDREPDLVIEEFKELNHGDFEMKSYDELKDKPEYQRWIGDTYNEAAPGGESRAAFDKRVMTGFDKLLCIDADSAVVVCHGGVIVSIMEWLFPGQRNFYQWQPRNGRGYTLDVTLSNNNAVLISEI